MPAIGVLWRFLDEPLKERFLHNPAGFPVEILDPEDPDSEALARCELLFTDCKPELLKKATSLKWISTSMAGAAQYCVPGLLPENVPLTNSAGAYGTAISEHMLTLTLMLLRRMDEYSELQREKNWRFAGQVRTLAESRVAVLGMGDIGSAYAKLCHAMGASVVGVRRTVHDKPDYVEALYAMDGVDEALKDADIVALALPGTPETGNVLSRERLEKLRPGCILINVGRGSLIDQEALAELLQSGHLGGAGLDVTVPEPLPEESPLWTAPRTVITPHVAGMNSSTYTLNRILDLYFENLLRYRDGLPLKRIVNRNLGY